MEIERKFRVTRISPGILGEGVKIVQGYLSAEPEVRVRLIGDDGRLTIKGKGSLARHEFEYPIATGDVLELMKMIIGRAIQKTRHRHGRWEIDVYEGHLVGLIIAEIELRSEGEQFSWPDWMKGYEVTLDPRYKNRHLAMVASLSDLSEANAH